MTPIDTVEHFLYEFHQKMKIWDIRFRDDRGKNTQALLSLEITPDYRIKVINALKPVDYISGPNENKINTEEGPLWVFGKKIKNTEIYIKICYGKEDEHVICISFHEAEHPLEYKRKNI